MTRKNKKPVIKAFKGLSAQMFPKMVDALRQHAPEKFKGFKQDASKKFGNNPNFAKAMKSLGMGELAKMPEAAKMMKSGGTVKRKRPIDGIAQRGRTRAK
tara:strand:- start:2577 stop:2876 length:300 start_codon:yes stop_codon:yes gene_type:complete